MIENFVFSKITRFLFSKAEGFILNLPFFAYPKIRGNYRVEYCENNYSEEYVFIEQKGANIFGNVKTENVEYELTGKVSRSRYITYHVLSKDINFDNFGAALLKLNQSGSEANGILLFLGEDGLPVSYRGKIVKL